MGEKSEVHPHLHSFMTSDGVTDPIMEKNPFLIVKYFATCFRNSGNDINIKTPHLWPIYLLGFFVFER